MCVTERIFHLIVIAQHALNTTGQFVFLAGLRREAGDEREEEEEEVKNSWIKGKRSSREGKKNQVIVGTNTWIICIPVILKTA